MLKKGATKQCRVTTEHLFMNNKQFNRSKDYCRNALHCWKFTAAWSKINMFFLKRNFFLQRKYFLKQEYYFLLFFICDLSYFWNLRLTNFTRYKERNEIKKIYLLFQSFFEKQCNTKLKLYYKFWSKKNHNATLQCNAT